jgi:carbon storage regulator
LLVLTRHVHQSIVIGHDVIVTVLEVRGDQVRLGITAPKDIQVHREEVFAALTAANRQAATSATELEVLKELSSEPIASSPAGPRQRPDASPGAPAPRRGPGLAPPANPDRTPGSQSAAGPGAGPKSGTGPGAGPSSSASTANQPRAQATGGSPSAGRSVARPSAATHQHHSK